MASVEIKGFGLTITTILKLKNTLDKILGDDLTVELDYLEGGIKMVTDEELRIKPNLMRTNK